ncbi:MAG: hypothetical protein NT067_04720 [Candidatus Diapherotrites archaeon]|nr:hypothetical protein [Candidatus Diapherotrites archaeon]
MAQEKKEGKRLKIGICVPLYNLVPSVFHTHFVNFFVNASRDYSLRLFQIDSVAVDVARNVLAEEFLKSDCDYLLFLDSDIVFPPNIIDLLIRHEKDFVSAIYFTRKKIKPMHRFLKDGEYVSPNEVKPGQLVEADAVGLGCSLIRREVVEKVSAQNKGLPLFKMEFRNRTEILGEDVFFCRLVQKAGFKIFVDTGTLVGHYGVIAPESAFRDYVY